MKWIKTLLAIIAWFPAATLACSCWHPEPDEYLVEASLIFRGTVLSVENVSPQAPPISVESDVARLRDLRSSMRAKFRVATSFKGPNVEEIEVAYSAGDGLGCGWRFSVGEEATVFARGNRTNGFSTDMCMMIPYAAYTKRGDNRYVAALEQYRTQRDAFAAKLRRKGLNRQTLQQQAAFFVKYKDLEDADHAYSNLLRLKHNDAKTLVARGNVRYAAERFADALADYQAAAAADTANTDAQHGRTLSLVKLGRMQELTANDRDFSGLDSRNGPPVSFAGASLKGAKFRGVTLSEIDFSGADLRGADFSGADIDRCNFTDARLTGAKFDNLQHSYNATFRHAALQYASFKGASLFHAVLDDAILDKADFSKANLESGSLAGAALSGTNFRGTSLLNVVLQKITLTGACYNDKTKWPAGFDPVAAGARTCR